MIPSGYVACDDIFNWANMFDQWSAGRQPITLNVAVFKILYEEKKTD